ncbi:MAG: helix-turn-helix domain-containing protein [Thermoanaerobaculia bacterium]
MPIEVQRHDSPLGRWLFARWSPPRLASVVSTIWYFEGTLAYLRERHFPDGLIDLVVHLGPVYRRVEGDRSEPFNRTCVAGLQLGPDVIEAPPGPSAVLGLELRPVGAFRVLGRPLHELTDRTVDLKDIAAEAATELAECCAAAATPEKRLRVAACWIDARVRTGPAPARAVTWLAGELERRNGAVPIGELQAQTGWSRTRLTTVFREQIGVPPKTLARFYRFRRALEMVHRAEVPLTEIALATGYYDQPHFNTEFRELSGFAPRDYLAQVRYPESVSVAEAAP